MKIAVIIPAAGSGTRFAQGASGHQTSKVEQDLIGRPVFLRAVELFLRRPQVAQIMVAVRPEDLDDFRFRWGDKLAFHAVEVIPGGKVERWETVLRALDHVQPECTHVAIHDAARPLTSAGLIDRLFEVAAKHPAVIPGLPVPATLKRVTDVPPDPDQADPLEAILGSAGRQQIPLRRVTETVDRSTLVEIQTPQVFALALIRRAYEPLRQGGPAGRKITDDAQLVEALGQEVMVVEGESTNLKITRPEDLSMARAWVQAHQQKTAAELARKRLFADPEEE